MMTGMVMDKRLLPYGFVWGVSLVAVYAAVLTFSFSDISGITQIWGFILGALLAAIYTHFDRSEFWKDEALRADRMKKDHRRVIFWLSIVLFAHKHLDQPELPKDALRADRMKKNYWHIIFWLSIILFAMPSSLDILSYHLFGLSPDTRRWGSPLMGAFIGWFTTRMPFATLYGLWTPSPAVNLIVRLVAVLMAVAAILMVVNLLYIYGGFPLKDDSPLSMT